MKKTSLLILILIIVLASVFFYSNFGRFTGNASLEDSRQNFDFIVSNVNTKEISSWGGCFSEVVGEVQNKGGEVGLATIICAPAVYPPVEYNLELEKNLGTLNPGESVSFDFSVKKKCGEEIRFDCWIED